MFKHPLLYVWIVLVGAFVGAGLLRPAIGQRQGESVAGSQSKKATDEKSGAESVAVPPSGKKNGRDAATDKDDCKTCTEHDMADLHEQRRMAKAAEAQNTINIVNGVLLFLTLLATAVAAFAASRAATFGAKSADVAEKALTQLQRAFVVLKEIHRGETVKDDASGIHSVLVAVSFENSGASPTRHAMNCVTFSEIYEADLPTNFDFSDVETGRDPPRFVVGPKAVSMTGSFGISFPTLERMRSGQTRGFIWGWVEYDDIFEDTPRHRTEFCFKAGKITPPLSAVKIEWEAYERHNGMDDECPPDRFRTMKGGAWIEPRKPRVPPRP